MNRLMVLGILVWMGIALHAQSLYPDFSKLNFGCDGNSITAGEQWSKTVVDKLGFATHHNVAVGSATWACHPILRIMAAKLLPASPAVAGYGG